MPSSRFFPRLEKAAANAAAFAASAASRERAAMRLDRRVGCKPYRLSTCQTAPGHNNGIRPVALTSVGADSYFVRRWRVVRLDIPFKDG